MKETRIGIRNACAILIFTYFFTISASAKLVGHWTFDQDSGSIVYNSIRLGSISTDGQVAGSAFRFIPSGAGLHGELGNACQFDAVNSCIALLGSGKSLVGKPEIFNLGTNDFTFTAWFKQGPIEKMNEPGCNPTIINNSTHNRNGILLKINRGRDIAVGRLSFNVKGTRGDNRVIDSDQRVDDGKWHWVVIRVKNKKMEMWIDGKHQMATMLYGANTTATQRTNTRFGGHSNDLVLDDFRLYNTALLQEQFKEIYDTKRRSSDVTILRTPSKEVAFYLVKPISNICRVPDTFPLDGNEGTTLEIVATPGEFEPASIVVYTRNGLGRVCFKADNLTGPGGTIDAKKIDIRSVKCWYQAGGAWQGIRGEQSRPVLVPELLLRDDSVVRIDYQKKTNYVKIHELHGDRYVDMSQANPKDQPGILNSQFPVYDSPVFLPMNIPANSYKQMWVTIQVPDQARPGLYSGNIEVSANGKPLQTLKLNLKVLPFKLADPKTYYDINETFTSSIYYKGILTWNREGTLLGWYKTEEQFRADLKNMAEHGVNNPLILQLEVDDNLEHLERVLEIRKELGLTNDPLYLLGKERNLGFEATRNPEKIKQAQERFKEIDAVAKKHGIKQVFIYGMDEVKGKELRSQIPIWKAFHEVGAKVFVAGFLGTPDRPEPYFDFVGKTLDVMVSFGKPFRQFAKQWHSTGKKIWAYHNPQGGVENPAVYRRNYGLSLWKANYDGACTYVYHHGYGHSWNDFDFGSRDHNLTYPTIDGVIDTIAWEGYREGIDDIRYATTLKLAIEKARHGSDPEKRKIAEQANQWLEDIDVRYCDLDIVRRKIIERILTLMEK